MRQVIIVSLALWLFSVFLVPAVGAAEVVRGIRVEGLRTIDEGTVLIHVTTKVGEELDRAKVTLDIKSIFRSGFFEEVDARTDRVADGTTLVFAVREKPSVRNVFVEGNEAVTDATLKEKLKMTSRRFLDRPKLRAGINEARAYYNSLGYYNAAISVAETRVGENQVDLNFTVEEGTKKVIREIRFVGNRALDSDDLLGAMRTRPYNRFISWFTGRGILQTEQLDEDVRALTRYYLTRGYVDVKVGQPSVEETDDGLLVSFTIEEGDVYQFGRIGASGTLLEDSEEQTLEGAKSKAGETFNSDTVKEDTFAISQKYTDRGYAFANVSPNTRIDRERRTVDVDYEIDQGNLITVNRINITGNRKTRENVIRRSLQLDERSLYSSSTIQKSQEQLQRLGYFSEVSIAPDRTADPREVDLTVGVKEADTGTFSIGAGVSSGDGFIVSTQISERNLFGTGNALALELNNGSRRRTYILSFTNPRVNDTQWSFSVDGQSVRREYDAFHKQETGAGFGFGYPLWFLGPELLEDVRFAVNYNLDKIEIEDFDADAPAVIIANQGSSISSAVTTKIVRNTIDNPIDPKRGSRQLLSVETAGLGGDEKFWLGLAQNTFYVPLFESPSIVFSQRTRFGYGDTFDTDPFPLFRRFFPGGINSVRGYSARELGPKDTQGREFGGNKELVLNFDLIFPLFSSIGLNGVVFYDAGQAFDDDDPIKVDKLRQAVGYGVRWRSPIAPIRIEIGYPLDREEGDSSVTTNFSFGSPQ